MTFSDHSSGVTGVCFNASGKVVLSCSLDGTVRAFDLHRYLNLDLLKACDGIHQSHRRTARWFAFDLVCENLVRNALIIMGP